MGQVSFLSVPLVLISVAKTEIPRIRILKPY